MTLLILGGVRDAKLCADRLHAQGVPLVYSLAGLLERHDAPYPIISGGFARFGADSVSGLANYLRDHQITAVADLTHPYAATISSSAVRAARRCEIPCWRYRRPPWRPGPQDRWIETDGGDDLLRRLEDYRRPFFTLGRSAFPLLAQAESLGLPAEQRWLIRSALPAPAMLASRDDLDFIQARGPFALQEERDLFDAFNVDALVCKNSGGAATEAKLQVAAERGLPVFMLRRPPTPAATREFDDLERFIEHCAAMTLPFRPLDQTYNKHSDRGPSCARDSTREENDHVQQR
ncbi:precorrin-6A/cobalt-precorrin-6A reductase [Hahella sp. NBU794]|uniref:precorrin-6A/cobalt-precorrin-6A reductase n=1 Tax=Hahella sp. NBU794 TaxID=3422590 RepID=UPI003D6F428D